MRRILLPLVISGFALGLAVPGGAVDYPVITGTLTVTSSSGSATSPVSPGTQIRVAGGGFAPGSSVQITFHSTPVLAATVQADAAGSIDVVVNVPQGLSDGQHMVQATGAAPGGGSVVLERVVTVAGGIPVPRRLAFTGADIYRLLAIGLLALIVGVALVQMARRHQHD